MCCYLLICYFNRGCGAAGKFDGKQRQCVVKSLTSARGDSEEAEGRRLGEYKAQSFDGDLFTFNVILTTFLALLTILSS